MTAHFAHRTRHPALDRLADRRLLRELAYIGGSWTASDAGRSFEVCDPASGASLAWVASLDGAQTSRAIDAAAGAFPKWRGMLPQHRATILRKWFELILAAKDDLALLMTLEQGKPLAESHGEIEYAASFVEWYAEEGKRLNAEGVTSHLPDAEMIVRREPLGVVGLRDALEFPVSHADPQGRRRAGCRLHHRRASLVADTALGAGACRTRGAGRAPCRRPQHRDGRCRHHRRDGCARTPVFAP